MMICLSVSMCLCQAQSEVYMTLYDIVLDSVTICLSVSMGPCQASCEQMGWYMKLYDSVFVNARYIVMHIFVV